MAVKRAASSESCTVFVRGFDFGTTDEQLEAHLSTVGTIAKVKWQTKGSAEVRYSSPEEAAAAVESLNKTTIEGNSRFIDVKIANEDAGSKRFKSGGKSWGKGGGGGVLNILQAILGGGGGYGKGGGKSWKKKTTADRKDDDPAGSGRVYVQGFDWGTTEAQVKAHMGAAGAIHAYHWVSKGSAIVVYEDKASAEMAVSQLHKTTLDGNSRFVDVYMQDSVFAK
eukprot:CAMPEP_0169127574 /NCGR_PEP_ID=MMETSP1015-20121227/36081_1 /TAXON_ID=342587 /ORGANISM="Karlodinium micrum, Strain CCMP2283" /LENGTH=223 /DNA_ID=CAMNT_0009191367 /DNA_START=55 /DNA_END=726 /DNA_ORIENTATION=+